MLNKWWSAWNYHELYPLHFIYNLYGNQDINQHSSVRDQRRVFYKSYFIEVFLHMYCFCCFSTFSGDAQILCFYWFTDWFCFCWWLQYLCYSFWYLSCQTSHLCQFEDNFVLLEYIRIPTKKKIDYTYLCRVHSIFCFWSISIWPKNGKFSYDFQAKCAFLSSYSRWYFFVIA